MLRKFYSTSKQGVDSRMRIVHWVAGLVLMTAAQLKAYQLATTPLLNTGLLTSRTMHISLVILEWLLGTVLVTGIIQRIAHRISTMVFLVFLGIALQKAISGVNSCGCMGTVEISSWWMAGIDLVLLVGFVCTMRVANAIEERPSLRRWLLGICGSVIGASWMLGQILSFRPVILPEEGALDTSDYLVVLEPKSWIGKALPLGPYIEVSDILPVEDTWFLLLHQYKCPTCREAMPEVLKMAQEINAKLVLVEVPSTVEQAGDLPPASTNIQVGRLKDEKHWFVTTPALLAIQNGVVQDVCQGEQVLGSRFDLNGSRFVFR